MTAPLPPHIRFRVLGQRLMGRPDWQHALARRLGVSARSVRRWAAGSWPVPANIWAQVEALDAAPQKPRGDAP